MKQAKPGHCRARKLRADDGPGVLLALNRQPDMNILRGSKILTVDPVLRTVPGEYEQVSYSLLERE